MVAQGSGPGGGIREGVQEIYLLDLVLSLYRVYARRLTDPAGRAILETYLRAEEDRARRLERIVRRRSPGPPTSVRALFRGVGRLYGRATSMLGTRVMLRIVLSAGRRASRRACSRADAAMRGSSPEDQYMATLRARNEADLVDALTQHLIDSRPKRV